MPPQIPSYAPPPVAQIPSYVPPQVIHQPPAFATSQQQAAYAPSPATTAAYSTTMIR